LIRTDIDLIERILSRRLLNIGAPVILTAEFGSGAFRCFFCAVNLKLDGVLRSHRWLCALYTIIGLRSCRLCSGFGFRFGFAVFTASGLVSVVRLLLMMLSPAPKAINNIRSPAMKVIMTCLLLNMGL